MKYLATFSLDAERDWHCHYGKGRRMEAEPRFIMIDRSMPRLMGLADRYGVKFTLYVTREVAEGRGELIATFRDIGHEVGVHTHPYCHPGVFKSDDLNHGPSDRLVRYTLGEQFEMINRDLSIVWQRIGVRPRSFKAGVNQLNGNTLRALDSLGFQTDASLYQDFFSPIYNPPPYAYSLSIFTEEVDITSVISNIHDRQLLDDSALSASMRRLLADANQRGDSFASINIATHPMIYGDTHLSVAECFRRLEKFLGLLKRMGVTFLTVSEFSKLPETRNYLEELERQRIRGQLMALWWRASTFIRPRILKVAWPLLSTRDRAQQRGSHNS